MRANAWAPTCESSPEIGSKPWVPHHLSYVGERHENYCICTYIISTKKDWIILRNNSLSGHFPGITARSGAPEWSHRYELLWTPGQPHMNKRRSKRTLRRRNNDQDPSLEHPIYTALWPHCSQPNLENVEENSPKYRGPWGELQGLKPTISDGLTQTSRTDIKDGLPPLLPTTRIIKRNWRHRAVKQNV